MTDDERRQKASELSTLLKRLIAEARTELDAMEYNVNALDALLADMLLQQGNGAPPLEKLRVVSPVTGKASDTPNPYGLDWFDATGYGTWYAATGRNAYHTGADLNRPNFADVGAPVYAAGDGEIVYSGAIPGWQGEVVVIKHALEDGSKVWTRYAHIKDARGLGGVKAGQQIGRIADYNRDGAKGDHLHFDVSKIDLGAKPDDWPGLSSVRVKEDYINPKTWLMERK